MGRRGFYAAGLFWVFYYNGTANVYRTSADGVGWSSETVVVTQNDPDQPYFSVWYDGRYMCYASIDPNEFRRGIPNPDGTITWSKDTQTPSELSAYQPSVILDSNRYPWIGWHNGACPLVSKSKYNDGRWQKDTGFPFYLSETSSASWDVQLVPLTNGKVYAVYTGWDLPIYGRLWNGSSWEDPEIIDPNRKGVHGLAQCVVAVNDDVHVVYNGRYYRRRDSITGTWGDEYDFGKFGNQGIAISKDQVGNIYVFVLCVDTDKIYYFKRSKGVWSGPVEWISETTLTYKYSFNVFYEAYNDWIGVIYQTGGSSDTYEIKFEKLFAPSHGYTNKVFAQNVESTEFNKVVNVFSRSFKGNPSFDVTLQTLTLGSRSSVTGWYEKNYVESTIPMVIIQKETQQLALKLGFWVALDALGITTEIVGVYDRIKDQFGRVWEVKAVKPIMVGDKIKYFVCDLKELPLNA